MSEDKTVEKKIDDLAASVARGFEEIRTEMQEGFSGVNSRIDKLETRVAHIDRRLDQFADHERRITRLEEKADF